MYLLSCFDKNKEMETIYIVSAVIGAIIVFIVSQAVWIVREGEMIVVEKLGRFSSIKKPGLNFLIPFIERPCTVEWNRRVERRVANKVTIVHETFSHYRIRTSNIVFDIPPVTCYTKEKVKIDVNIIVYYNIVNLEKAVYKVADLYASIESKVETLLINLVYNMSIEEIHNQELQRLMFISLKQEQWPEEWGITINRFDIQEVIFPQQLSDATLSTVTMRRTQEAEKLSIETAKLKKMAELDSAEMIAEKQRSAELNRKAFELKQLQLDYEFQNVKLLQQSEAQIKTEKSQVDLAIEAKERKYKAMKDSGRSDEYFIQRKRTKSICALLEAGIKGEGKTLVLPLESLLSTGNPLLLNRILSSDKPLQETFVVNK